MRLLTLLLLLVSCVLNLHAADKGGTPEALVAELYKSEKKEASPFFQDKNRALVDHYFTKELGGLIWKDTLDAKGEVGAIDGDPLYDAQDTEIKEFVIHPAKTEEGKSTVLVTFVNFEKKKRITFHCVQQGGAWKISDIQYSEGHTLLKLLKDNVGK
ncbi:MAG: DUF3828 domain-containing protein [Prosthecobacter sp.]|uniref:DUF3828 domain-containing protein n=1 Tax=Prosthecobacter sp. TaxID=1965333 RepID=UPI0025EEF19C|nr:DUF3828 domain-containing protein [Prosthecobacter sp.]MCF7785540.1 DUF3828 domain-containing protein [Prosthecobacter sp.]